MEKMVSRVLLAVKAPTKGAENMPTVHRIRVRQKEKGKERTPKGEKVIFGGGRKRPINATVPRTRTSMGYGKGGGKRGRCCDNGMRCAIKACEKEG